MEDCSSRAMFIKGKADKTLNRKGKGWGHTHKYIHPQAGIALKSVQNPPLKTVWPFTKQREKGRDLIQPYDKTPIIPKVNAHNNYRA